MLENIVKFLKSKKIKCEVENDDTAEIISFSYKYDFGEVPCEISYDKENDVTKFYTEVGEFDQDSRVEGFMACHLCNYDTFYLKFYMSDDNNIAGERYLTTLEMTDDDIEGILADMETIADTIEPYNL